MRKNISIVLAALVILSGGLLISQQSAEDAKFQKALDSYMDEYWKFYPTAATLAGYYKYNDKLEDLGGRTIERRHDALDKFNQEFVAKIDKTKLSPDMQVDYEITIDALDLELLNHENLIPWDYNPLFYNEILFHSIRSLLTKDFAPIASRVRSAAERTKQLPGFLKQAKDNLKTPPQIHTETAVKQFQGILDFYRTEALQLAEAAPADAKARFQAELSKAVPALEDYQRFLQTELLPRSTGNFRLGEQAHIRLLRLICQTGLPFDEYMARSRADYNNIRREMFLVCIPFYKIMDPKIDLEKPPANLTEEQIINLTLSHVMNKIKEEHTGRTELLDRIRLSANEIKEFIQEEKLLDLPEAELQIEPIPPGLRGGTWARLVTPGVYETEGSYTSLVSPIPEDWTDELANSFLKEFNNFYIYFWTTRNVFPGLYVPTYHTRKFRSPVRNLFPNQALLKSWPIYIEEMLILAGFHNYDLRMRLNQLKLQLKTVIDFQMDINLHQGGMTKEQAVSYMTRGGFQTQAEAARNWERLILNPGVGVFPYVGFQEILDIEKDYRRLKGEAFSQKEFLQALLGNGALPLRHLRAKVLQ